MGIEKERKSLQVTVIKVMAFRAKRPNAIYDTFLNNKLRANYTGYTVVMRLSEYCLLNVANR